MPRKPFFYARNTSAKRVFSRSLSNSITRRVRSETYFSNQASNRSEQSGEPVEELRKKYLELDDLRVKQIEAAKAASPEISDLCTKKENLVKILGILIIISFLYFPFIFVLVMVDRADLVVKSWPLILLLPAALVVNRIVTSYGKKLDKKMMELGFEGITPNDMRRELLEFKDHNDKV